MVTALGTTAATTWDRLLAGKSGLGLRQPFPELSPRPVALVGNQPGDLNDFLGLAVAEAIADACLPLPQPDCGVVIGSSRSFQSR
ncbi:3-oxoacyl-ACP synthase, partial [filamentous cyanobacterium CCP4]